MVEEPEPEPLAEGEPAPEEEALHDDQEGCQDPWSRQEEIGWEDQFPAAQGCQGRGAGPRGDRGGGGVPIRPKYP